MKTFVVCLLTFLAAIPAWGQWEYGGKLIGYYSYYTHELAATSVGNGNTVVVWSRPVNGDDYDILASYIDSAGYLRWGENGLAVNEDDSIDQLYPAILADGHGGVFVVWSDRRHWPQQGTALYAQHLDSLGNKLWDPSGVRMTASDTLEYEMMSVHGITKLIDDGNGGFIAVCEVRHGWDEINIAAQRVMANGTIPWDSTGIYLTQARGWEATPLACKISDSAFVAIWRDERFLYYPDSTYYDWDIYMQKFDLSGNILWGRDGIPVIHWPNDQEEYDLVPDGRGGFIVVWLDSRNYYSTLFANRYSASGQPIWLQSGIQLGNEQTSPTYGSQIVKYGSPDTILIRWLGGSRQINFRITGLDLNGNTLWPNLLYLDSTGGADPAIMEPGGYYKYITYHSGTPQGFIGKKCDLSGHQYWPNFPFITNNMSDLEALLFSDDHGGMITLWQEAWPWDIRISRIYADGYVGGDTTAIDESYDLLPSDLKLTQNYPNPFNSSTVIEYDLAVQSEVSIDIFDILGRKIATMAQGIKPAGEHKAFWDAGAQSSGIYFYRLKAGDKTETRKMVLIK